MKKMLTAAALCASACVALATPVTLTTLRVSTQSEVAELKCAPAPHKPAAPRPVDPDPVQMPSDEDVQSELQALAPEAIAPPAKGGLGRAAPGEPYRVGIWGDSHLAAGFFTNELARLLQLGADDVRPTVIGANMNRAGVRLPLRKTCVSAQWRYESAYAHAAAAAAPGPALVNLVSAQSGATLAWDLRSASGPAHWPRLRLLYQQTAQPVTLGVSVDGGEELELTLAAAPGPAALELQAEQAISVLRLRLLRGALTVHGLALAGDSAPAVQMDVFGIPGATVAGWARAQADYLGAWYPAPHYQLVMLEFGTNEGNVKPFNAASYEQTLRESLGQLVKTFPDSACVLMAPGDRGVLVRRSTVRRKKSSSKTARPVPARKADLLQYTTIHAEIGRIQQAVAAEHGCRVWSMLGAMGGAGSAYRWARQTPALMAKDLTHFTPAGYQQLARQFALDMDWGRAQLLGGR